MTDGCWKYKGFTAKLRDNSDDPGVIFGRADKDDANFLDIITFQGRTLEEAERSFRESVDDYLSWLAEDDQ